jgi:hypothetical protein
MYLFSTVTSDKKKPRLFHGNLRNSLPKGGNREILNAKEQLSKAILSDTPSRKHL